MRNRVVFVLACCCLGAAIISCDNKIVVPDDILGISLKNTDVFVEYTNAKVYGEISVSERPERISEVVVKYGVKTESLNQSVKATFNAKSFSADLTSLEDGAQYYYSVDIIVGKTCIPGEVNEFITFPQGPIDLDLPSGEKWASQNLGATNPTAFGDYYAWGELTPKTCYDWSTYVFCNGDSYHLTKYVTIASYSDTKIVDDLTELQPQDDAARNILGAGYSIPSYQDWEEIINNCNISVVVINGVRGCKVSSRKDMNNNKKYIFIPGQNGYYSGTTLLESGVYGHYWTSTLQSLSPISAHTANLNSIGMTTPIDLRCNGNAIRPVFKQ